MCALTVKQERRTHASLCKGRGGAAFAQLLDALAHHRQEVAFYACRHAVATVSYTLAAPKKIHAAQGRELVSQSNSAWLRLREARPRGHTQHARLRRSAGAGALTGPTLNPDPAHKHGRRALPCSLSRLCASAPCARAAPRDNPGGSSTAPAGRTERRTSARALLRGGHAGGRPRATRRAAPRGRCRPLRPIAVLSRAWAAGAPCEHAARARRPSPAAAPRAPARRTSAAAARRPCSASPRASGSRPTCGRAQAASQQPRGRALPGLLGKQVARRARARCRGPATHRTQRARWPMKPRQSVQAPLRTLGLAPPGG